MLQLLLGNEVTICVIFLIALRKIQKTCKYKLGYVIKMFQIKKQDKKREYGRNRYTNMSRKDNP